MSTQRERERERERERAFEIIVSYLEGSSTICSSSLAL